MRKVVEALSPVERRVLTVVADVSVALFAAGLITAILQFIFQALV